MELHIPQLQSVDAPEGLIGIINLYVLKAHILHLAEEFRRVDDGVFHHHIITVPYGRARLRVEVAVGDDAVVDMPPGIFAIELRVVALYVMAHLDCRLTVGNGNIIEYCIVNTEERTLTAKLFIFYSLHC